MKPDDLKAGNPALTDEHVQYGLRRAGEIFAKQAARGAIEGQPRRPGTLQLSDYQLAAIIAGAYADGACADVSALPKFYECGGCDHYHPFGWTGDCRDDTQRFTTARLDEIYGTQWLEVNEETGEAK